MRQTRTFRGLVLASVFCMAYAGSSGSERLFGGRQGATAMSAGGPNIFFIARWGSDLRSDGRFNLPFGIAADSRGDLYVSDGLNNRIQKFHSDGTFVAKWGRSGS